MKVKNPSLAIIAKEYSNQFPENVDDFIFDHLNDRMKNAVEVFKHQSIVALVIALLPLMTKSELEKLGEYLIENRLINEYKGDYYFEIPEGIHYNGALFDC